MLTKGDDYPIHQTPEPIAYAGSDRNFYDRYFFNAYSPDGSAFVAIAYGVYPALNVADAHIAIVKDGKEYCLHASRVLGLERMDLHVGPISIDILEPLQKLKVTVTKAEGIAGEITFEGRAFPIEEPRFVKRNGPRLFMDYTRLTQNVRASGWLEVDGERIEVSGWVGTRDRSWGIRPVGAPDTQPTPGAGITGFFWQWSPLNFADRSVYFHINADPDGKPWNTRAVILEDGAPQGGGYHTDTATMETRIIPGTRHASGGVLTIPMEQGAATVKIEPVATFLMRGIGYGGDWRHGGLKGDLAVAREDLDTVNFDPNDVGNLHIQAISKATLSVPGQADQQGVGVFEQLILGPYRPLGF
ncbi:MAG: hypothetical protein KKE02_01940 [Alphaproteobacteria bacterium]|nr:hypothetical protein [Alphaproteobacteria bacterium]MBU1515075.1 hypothetical protein [Alphaproteobacteria bacterium]MBU2093433.1 hypothetical protein [Alphaproteobacteria bacterium]MBU2149752.1 hypothetical protein [Alphaproteobacteria bacterium]MBU2308095.1 hypothetical protein [Alphaproteobacteria bacterium]